VAEHKREALRTFACDFGRGSLGKLRLVFVIRQVILTPIHVGTQQNMIVSRSNSKSKNPLG